MLIQSRVGIIQNWDLMSIRAGLFLIHPYFYHVSLCGTNPKYDEF